MTRFAVLLSLIAVLGLNSAKLNHPDADYSNSVGEGFNHGMCVSKIRNLEDICLKKVTKLKKQVERTIKRHGQVEGDLLEVSRNISNYEKDIKGIHFGDGSRKIPIDDRRKIAFTAAKQFNNYITSCREVQTSGWYFMDLPDSNYIRVYCEQRMFGGGWILMQYRFDGSVSFYRNWDSYRDAFGFLDGEYWLGLENLHKLTSWRNSELLVYLTDFDGFWKYARYDRFAIGNETEQYYLKTLGSFYGTAGDSLSVHRGQNFSTPDVDNDQSSDVNCAVRNHGAWWYNSCGSSNLNGMYTDKANEGSMYWYSFNNYDNGLATSRMLIREV